MNEPTSNARATAISRKDAGLRLLPYFTARFTYQSESDWQEHIARGRVTLNGETCTGSEVLKEKDIVSFTPEPYDEPPVNTGYRILAEDGDFLFIDKPPLLPCHPAGIYLFNTLWGLLRDEHPRLCFINRLDRETSGIVIAAKNPEAAAYANGAMQERRIGKEYLSLVEGAFPETLDAPGFLVSDTTSPIRKKLRFVPDNEAASYGAALCDAEGGFQPGEATGFCANADACQKTISREIRCHTRFSLRSRLDGNLSLVHAELLTGRTHQIRATLQSLGFPVVGDKLYGKDPTIFLRFIDGTMTESDRNLLRLDHQALHCSRVVLPKADGSAYDIRADIPTSWGI